MKYFVTIVLCLNTLCLKAVNEITARQTRTSLHKRDVIKVCSIEHHTNRISVANFNLKICKSTYLLCVQQMKSNPGLVVLSASHSV